MGSKARKRRQSLSRKIRLLPALRQDVKVIGGKMVKAKKKMARRPARPKKVNRVKKDRAVPGGLAAGGLIGLGAAVSGTQAGGAYGGMSALTWAQNKSLTPMKRAENALRSATANALTSEALTPVVVGAGISILGPKIPVIGKPANRIVRKISKGKVSL